MNKDDDEISYFSKLAFRAYSTSTYKFYVVVFGLGSQEEYRKIWYRFEGYHSVNFKSLAEYCKVLLEQTILDIYMTLAYTFPWMWFGGMPDDRVITPKSFLLTCRVFRMSDRIEQRNVRLH